MPDRPAPAASGHFQFLAAMPPAQIAAILAGENHNLAGTVLAQLPPALAAKVLANMSAGRQREVVAAMRDARDIPSDVLARVAASLKKTASAAPPKAAPPSPAAGRPSRRAAAPQPWQPRIMADAPPPPGPQGDAGREQAMARALRMLGEKRAPAAKPRPGPRPANATRKLNGAAIAAEILRKASPNVRRNLAENEPGLYQELRQRMFVFEDLLAAPPAALATLFTAVDARVAALALRFAPDQLVERALAAVSPRRAGLLRDEMALRASGMERTRVTDIEKAQAKVLQAALLLQQGGRIVIDPEDPELDLTCGDSPAQ